MADLFSTVNSYRAWDSRLSPPETFDGSFEEFYSMLSNVKSLSLLVFKPLLFSRNRQCPFINFRNSVHGLQFGERFPRCGDSIG